MRDVEKKIPAGADRLVNQEPDIQPEMFKGIVHCCIVAREIK
jgi:hypothetical protein